MTGHWRLALRSTAWIGALAVPVGAAILYFYGQGALVAFGYGVGAGVLSYVSMAATVSLLRGRSTGIILAIGASSLVARLGFAAAVLGIPAYLDLWPVLPMLGGFAGVYAAENVVLMLVVPRTMRGTGAENSDELSTQDKAEQKVEA